MLTGTRYPPLDGFTVWWKILCNIGWSWEWNSNNWNIYWWVV